MGESPEKRYQQSNTYCGCREPEICRLFVIILLTSVIIAETAELCWLFSTHACHATARHSTSSLKVRNVVMNSKLLAISLASCLSDLFISSKSFSMQILKRICGKLGDPWKPRLKLGFFSVCLYYINVWSGVIVRSRTLKMFHLQHSECGTFDSQPVPGSVKIHVVRELPFG